MVGLVPFMSAIFGPLAFQFLKWLMTNLTNNLTKIASKIMIFVYILFKIVLKSFKNVQIIFLNHLQKFQTFRFRYGVKRTILVSQLIEAFGLVLYAVAWNLKSVWVLFAGRLITGTGTHNLSLHWLTRAVGKPKRGWFSQLQSITIGFGMAFGPILGWRKNWHQNDQSRVQNHFFVQISSEIVAKFLFA